MRTTFKPAVETLEARDCPTVMCGCWPSLIAENGGYKAPLHQGQTLVLDTNQPVVDLGLYFDGREVADQGAFTAHDGQIDFAITPQIQQIADAQWYHSAGYNKPVNFTITIQSEWYVLAQFYVY